MYKIQISLTHSLTNAQPKNTVPKNLKFGKVVVFMMCAQCTKKGFLEIELKRKSG